MMTHKHKLKNAEGEMVGSTPACRIVMIDPSENFTSTYGLIASKHFISSAKLNITDELIVDGRSLMYTKNSSGPKMLPCGTPDNRGKHLDRQFLIDTR